MRCAGVSAVILRTFCQQDPELQCIVPGALEALCGRSKRQSCPYARHEGVCGIGGIGKPILERITHKIIQAYHPANIIDFSCNPTILNLSFL